MPKSCNDNKASVKWMAQCIRQAKDAIDKGAGPFAALIVRHDKLVASAVNQVSQHHDPTAHAEIGAIRAAGQKLATFRLDDCVLYSSSEPCPMCLSAIFWAKIPCVYYANDYLQAQQAGFADQFIDQQLQLPHAQKAIHIQQIKNSDLLRDAQEIFIQWQNYSDKIQY